MGFVAIFESLKNMVAPPGESARSILHIHFGIALYILFRLLSRRRLGPIWALIGVMVLEGINETLDLAATWPVLQAWQIRDTTQDILNTLLWPVVLCLLTLWQARPRRR